MRIGIPAPAGGVSKEDFEKKLSSFRAAMASLGLEIEIAHSVLAGSHSGSSYLAAPDEVRAREFMDMVRRPDIHAIVCARGGYGTMRILPLLDFEAIRSHPKIYCGYSDITALLNAIYQRANIITFHGPIAAAELDAFTFQHFRSMVTRDDKHPRTAMAELENLTTIHPGKAIGRLVGGNLTLIASTMGTPYEIATESKILFLEDVGEKAYRIDRMLTQLWLSGKLQKCAGIILGQFTETDDVAGATTAQQVLLDRFASLGIPVIGNTPVGHVQEKLTMPIGANVELDASNKRIRVLESAVTG